MKRSLILMLGLCLLSVLSLLVASNPVESQQVPTLVPPTPIPRPESGEEEIIPSESTVARIIRNGTVRVGILYNAPPFGELNIRGELVGFDADLARSMAETWGVEIAFVQVTRQADTTARMLRSGQVDMLVAASVHRREFDPLFDFSQTYYLGSQSMMVLTDDGATTPQELANRRVGVVIGTPAQNTLNEWLSRSGIVLTTQTYLTLDQAYSALLNGEVDAVTDSFYRLRQVSLQRPDLTRILETSIAPEPFSIAVLRQDANMRDLVNQTLQYLRVSGRLDEILQQYFPGTTSAALTVWDNLPEDAPIPSEGKTTFVTPAAFTVPRILNGQSLRVAGLYGVTADADVPESERRLDTFHRALINEMASRWGVTAEFITNNPASPLDLLTSGQADIVVGLTPDWLLVDQVDFTGPYLLHGQRLMVRFNDEINSFIDLRGGGKVITPINEPDAAPQAVEIAELPNVNARIEIDQQPENSLGFVMLSEEDDFEPDAIFGDSLKLIPHVQANPDSLRLVVTEEGSARWYSPSNVSADEFAPRQMVLGVPNNDTDFRLLVEYTLQEMASDGTLAQLLQPVMLPEDIPQFERWPGVPAFLGISLRDS